MSKKDFPHIMRVLPLVVLIALLSVSVYSLDSVKQLFTRAQGQTANINVDTNLTLEPIQPSWNSFAQGGEESTNMIAPVVSETRALSPRYIRIDHLYDFYQVVGRDGQGNLTFDFTRLDEVVQSIRQTGALPFFSLSYMPPVISETGQITDKPKNWNEWALVVQRTIERYSGTQGLNLQNVYYEVWNEPDLFGGWKYYGPKNYLTLYSYAVQGANNARNVNPFKIGGPATTQLYKNWIEAIARYTTENSVRLDFLSWHRYDKNPTQYATDIQNITDWLFPFPEVVALPRIISEWGFDSNNHAGYDGRLAAAHMVATIRQALYGYRELIAFEIVDGKSPENKPYWGRWGLMTHPSAGKTTKPRYHAFQLLSQVQGKRLLLRGEGTWISGIASKTDTDIYVLLVNYDYSGSHTETVPFLIQGLNNTTYQIKRTFLGQATTTENVSISNGQYQTEIIMPVNGVFLIKLTPVI